jgi:hypothetical protein
MKQYLLSLQQPDGDPPPPDVLDRIMTGLGSLNAEIQAAGSWVFAGGLHGPDAATVVTVRDGEALITDGPYAEGKEHIGGITIVQAPDLDVVLAWARRMAEITTLPVEVRPFQGEA